MAVVHAQIETIHPFIDGRKRQGQGILLSLMLTAEGHTPVYLAGYALAIGDGSPELRFWRHTRLSGPLVLPV